MTALYDEGESSEAGPAMVTWDPVLLTLTGAQTIVPPNGGSISYGVHLVSTIPNSFPGVNYWTTVTLPNGQEFGPLFQISFQLVPFMDVEVFNLTQFIPGLAPPGDYLHEGYIGYYPVVQVSDGFEFEKIGGLSAGSPGEIPFDPVQWPASAPELGR